MKMRMKMKMRIRMRMRMKDLPPSPSEHKEQLDWTTIKRSRGCDQQKTNKQTNKKTTIRQGEVVVF